MRPRLRVIPRGPWAREGNVSTGVAKERAAARARTDSLHFVKNEERSSSVFRRESVTILSRACGITGPLSLSTVARNEPLQGGHRSGVAAQYRLIGSVGLRTLNAAEVTGF